LIPPVFSSELPNFIGKLFEKLGIIDKPGFVDIENYFLSILFTRLSKKSIASSKKVTSNLAFIYPIAFKITQMFPYMESFTQPFGKQTQHLNMAYNAQYSLQ
jgi:hypothetical protein